VVCCELWKIKWRIMNLMIKSVFWCVLNVHLNYVNFEWCLYNDFGTNEIKNEILGDFWEGFPRQIFLGSQKQGACWASRWLAMGGRGEQHMLFCAFWGCFWTSLSVPYVIFWCCFDELSLCNHACLKLNELCWFETNFDYTWTWTWNRIEVRFFANEMLMLWLNYCDNEYRRSM